MESSVVPRSHSVFVYGSLLADEVLSVLLKRIPSATPAILHNYRRYSIKGRVYPAILPAKDKSVSGKVLLGITDSELETLDTFEDFEYERRLVDVEKLDSLEMLNAYAYVWNENTLDLHGDWNFDEWRQIHMKDFVGMTVAFMVDMEPTENSRVAINESGESVAEQ